MTDEHLKSAVTTAKGTVEASAGKLAGNKRLEAKGEAHKLEGKAQKVLADVEDAVTRTRRS
jgi:uncharacterized protein YjbJ (UPF0337 family)